eukprot:84931-Chlamydomonas_euryale.AAC.1
MQSCWGGPGGEELGRVVDIEQGPAPVGCRDFTRGRGNFSRGERGKGTSEGWVGGQELHQVHYLPAQLMSVSLPSLSAVPYVRHVRRGALNALHLAPGAFPQPVGPHHAAARAQHAGARPGPPALPRQRLHAPLRPPAPPCQRRRAQLWPPH